MSSKAVVDRGVLASHLTRGWVLVPVRGRAAGSGWTQATEPPTLEQLGAWLDGGATGLGLYHGASGTADVDCDCAEAAALAPLLLPRTGAWWSRPLPEGGVRSHYLYRCPAARFVAGDKICELLAGKKQSVLPGSWHEKTGEVICWGDAGEPAEVEASTLEAAVLEIKVGTVIGRRLRDGRGERHDLYLAVVGALAQAGWSFERVELLSRAWVETGFLDFVPNSLTTTYERHAGARTVTQWGELRKYLGDDETKLVRRWACRVGGHESELDGGEDARPVIDLTGRVHLGDDVAAVCEELATAGGIWSSPAGLSVIAGDRLIVLTRDTLRVEVSRRVHFRRVGSKGVKSIAPPNEIVGALHDGETGLPRLDRVSSVPVLRGDGSVACEPGYDPRTASFLTDAVRKAPAIGATRGEAVAALELLSSLVDEVPFADDRARWAWLAGLLTECAGAALGDEPVPAWWIEANSQGAGKSTLAALALAIGRGRRPSQLLLDKRGQLDERDMAAALLAPDGSIWVDNLVGRLDDPTLAALVTSGRASIRKYHTQQIVEGRLLGRGVWITTNGGSFGADWTRRVVPVQLQLLSGRAVDKVWSVRNPLALVLEHRVELYCAAVTILHAYARCGARQVVRWYGFEAWADLVLGSLQWLGAHDLGSLQRDVAAEYDDETEGTERLLVALASYLESIGEPDVTARALADDGGPQLRAVDGGRELDRLRAVLRELSGFRSGDSLSARRVARVLRQHGRPVGNRRITHTRTVHGDRMWGVDETQKNGSNSVQVA